MPLPDAKIMRRVAGDVLLAGLYAYFAYTHQVAFAASRRPSLLLLAVFESIVVVLALTRDEPLTVRRDWWALATTAGGSFLSLLLRPVAGAGDLPAGQVVQVVGIGLQLAALLSLGRSFGLLPADRGIKARGLYRWVRHPLYVSYFLNWSGYVLSNPSPWNLAILLAACTCQVLRVREEERLLMGNAAYAAYAGAVRYRLIPGVW